MTDTAGFQGRTVRVATAAVFPKAPLLSEAYWGITVKSSAEIPVWIQVSQAASMVFGAGFAAATLGIWGLPSAAVQVDSFFMRTGLSIFFAVMGFLLISYANRGVASDLQFDFGLGEVREVITNRSGRSVLMAHFGLDAFVGLKIDRTSGDAGRVGLILEHLDPNQNILVATSTDAEIGKLYGRLERDMLGDYESRRFTPNTSNDAS